MNIRALTLVFTFVGALALVACKTETGGGGGSGGFGGSTGGATCGATCVEALDWGCIDSGAASETQFNALANCASASCMNECSAFVSGNASDATCSTCLQDVCKTEFDECSNAI